MPALETYSRAEQSSVIGASILLSVAQRLLRFRGIKPPAEPHLPTLAYMELKHQDSSFLVTVIVLVRPAHA